MWLWMEILSLICSRNCTTCLALLSSNEMLMSLGCTQGGRNQHPGCVKIINETQGKSYPEKDH